MRVVVTGATGFVGDALVVSLAGDGHEPIALARSPRRARERQPALVGAHRWDAFDGPPPREAFENADAVVHLLGEPVAGFWTKKKKRAIHDSRVIGTRHLVETLRSLDGGPRVLVSSSAIGYYGDRDEETLTETSTPGSDFLARLCVDWESAARDAASAGIRVVTLRTGLVLGATDGPLATMLPAFRMGLGGKLGSGRQWWSWVHIDDMVRLIRFAIDTPIEGALNATAPGPTRQGDYASALATAVKRPAFLPAPGWALRLGLGEFSTELLSSKRVLPERALAEGFTFSFESVDRALADLL